MSDSLDDIAAKIKATEKPRRITVRKLLGAIGQERRGKKVTQQLKAMLMLRRLRCEPDFDDVHIDAVVTLTLKPRVERARKPPVREGTAIETSLPPSIGAAAQGAAGIEAPRPVGEGGSATRVAEPATAGSPEVEGTPSFSPQAIALEPPFAISERDVVITVRKGIPAAGCAPISVRRNEPARRALTKMIDQNIGELVVMSAEKGQVEGIFSWESYGRAVFANRKCETVGDCLSHDYGEVKESMPLFNAVREIITRGIVVVRARDGLLCGLVTQRDVAGVFVELAEPFLFLGQIENHLRELVERMRLSQEQLRALADERDSGRAARVAKVDDFTLGELIRAIQNPEYWAKLALNYDRSIILQRLDRVGQIRNKVMHFDADGISPADKTFLTSTRRILQEL